jgi:hypothetical protein
MRNGDELGKRWLSTAWRVVQWRTNDPYNERATAAMVRGMTADLVEHLATALFAGGGLWLAVREIAKQVGETRRTRIKEEALTERRMLDLVMTQESQPAEKKPETQSRLGAA